MRLLRAILVAAIFCFVGTLAAAETSAERKIAAAKQAIASNLSSAEAYNNLAAAFCERANETGLEAYFGDAGDALRNSFRIAPEDYTARKIQVTVWLGQQNWVAAEEAAYRLNYLAPDDPAVWGLVAETNLALGNYAEAQKAAQWMFDLRPANATAFEIGAKLREAFGDNEGAIEFMDEALRRVPETERERRAMVMTGLGRLYFLNGEAKRAGAMLAGAKELFPEYRKGLAQVEVAKGSPKERSVRHDIGTLDASAWALFQNGKFQEAKAEIDLALAIGTKDAGVLAHAQQIEAALAKK